MYVCRFASVLQRYPHFSETLIIRRLMPKHSLVTVELEKSKRTAPYKAKFVNEKGEEISDLLEKMYVVRMISNRFRVSEFEVGSYWDVVSK
ncbi:unnamed protein product [Anisakis simplex]|uniref:Transcriptional regulator n=1 Tax=Anisakis simplex TaxID=6269 RepID=A0A0M3JIE3_ANISI|nr:unnamed protein product [Anisakis simplex]